jgi:phosphoribosylformylglycinamidine cyclo-ligase
LPSSGLHTNGYSLGRHLAFNVLGLTVDSHVPALGETVGAAFLRPHRSYLKVVAPLVERGWIKGMAHITGGGITENLPRTLPEGRTYSLDRGSWTVPPMFSWLQQAGGLEDSEMFRVFNMGVGFILIVSAPQADTVLSFLHNASEPAWRLGLVV